MDSVRPIDRFVVAVDRRGQVKFNRCHAPRSWEPLLQDDTTGGAEGTRSPPIPQVGLTQSSDSNGGCNDLVDITC